jgi:hypothetical protein
MRRRWRVQAGLQRGLSEMGKDGSQRAIRGFSGAQRPHSA